VGSNILKHVILITLSKLVLGHFHFIKDKQLIHKVAQDTLFWTFVNRCRV